MNNFKHILSTEQLDRFIMLIADDKYPDELNSIITDNILTQIENSIDNFTALELLFLNNILIILISKVDNDEEKRDKLHKLLFKSCDLYRTHYIDIIKIYYKPNVKHINEIIELDNDFNELCKLLYARRSITNYDLSINYPNGGKWHNYNYNCNHIVENYILTLLIPIINNNKNNNRNNDTIKYIHDKLEVNMFQLYDMNNNYKCNDNEFDKFVDYLIIRSINEMFSDNSYVKNNIKNIISIIINYNDYNDIIDEIEKFFN